MAMVRVEDGVHRAAKVKAAERGETLTAVVGAALAWYVDRPETDLEVFKRVSAEVFQPGTVERIDREVAEAMPLPKRPRRGQALVAAVRTQMDATLSDIADEIEATALCRCGHRPDQHRPNKGSSSLFCQVAGCTCRVAG
jgi:hypothetical protein